MAQTSPCLHSSHGIDYCNTVLHGAPTGTIQKLQQVQNNAARIVFQASSVSDAKPLLHRLHWLPVQQRITYKLAVLTYKVRSTSTPVYLNDQIMNVSVAELYVQLSSRCWSNRSPGHNFPDVLSDTQHRLSGTRCHKQFSSAILCLFLNLDLKLSYSRRLSLNRDTGIRGLMRGTATLPQGNRELLVVQDKVGRPPGELGVSKSVKCNIFPSVL